MREQSLATLMHRFSQILEQNIPQMITFLDNEIDLQPWERWASPKYISQAESELSLMPLLHMMSSYASIPTLFGSALLEKYPELAKNVFELDKGMAFFLLGLPAWFPWPGVMKAHIARKKSWRSLDDYQRVLDELFDGKPFDSSWGNLDDVSDIILARHKIFKEKGFDIRERGDLGILWALVINANSLAFWLIIYIYSTPGLIESIRKEISPYVVITQGIIIGKISEAPRLLIFSESLFKNCPLLKASYFEALRLTNRPWSIRKVARDFEIRNQEESIGRTLFEIKKNEYLAIPHELHMRDQKYFDDPEKFDPQRFLSRRDDGSLSVDTDRIRPYGGGPSMCKGRLLAERECLSLVAGIIAYWEIEPADKILGWKIPRQQRTIAVSRPACDFRVRIKRRNFEWKGNLLPKVRS